MKSTAPDDLPTHPDALREMVLHLLREQEEKDTEHARQLAVKDRYLTLRENRKTGSALAFACSAVCSV